MDRFEASFERILLAIGVFGAMTGYLSYAPSIVGLDVALHGLVAVLVVIAIALLWALHRDVDDAFSNLETKVGIHTEEVVQEVEDLHSTLTDGGGWRQVPNHQVDKEKISGVPSIAGAAIGGVLGSMIGPGGAAAGAALGALLGSGIEYNDLKDRHQETLQRTAMSAVVQETGQKPVEVIAAGDTESDGERYWQFTLRTGKSPTLQSNHEVLIKKSDGTVWYRPSSDRGQALYAD